MLTLYNGLSITAKHFTYHPLSTNQAGKPVETVETLFLRLGKTMLSLTIFSLFIPLFWAATTNRSTPPTGFFAANNIQYSKCPALEKPSDSKIESGSCSTVTRQYSSCAMNCNEGFHISWGDASRFCTATG